jgi:hypothetical protein
MTDFQTSGTASSLIQRKTTLNLTSFPFIPITDSKSTLLTNQSNPEPLKFTMTRATYKKLRLSSQFKSLALIFLLLQQQTSGIYTKLSKFSARCIHFEKKKMNRTILLLSIVAVIAVSAMPSPSDHLPVLIGKVNRKKLRPLFCDIYFIIIKRNISAITDKTYL